MALIKNNPFEAESQPKNEGSSGTMYDPKTGLVTDRRTGKVIPDPDKEGQDSLYGSSTRGETLGR